MSASMSYLEDQEKTCKKCGSSRIYYTKHLLFSESGKKTFMHYKLHCEDCKKVYFVQRNRVVYELIKNDGWKINKNSVKRIFGYEL